MKQPVTESREARPKEQPQQLDFIETETFGGYREGYVFTTGA